MVIIFTVCLSSHNANSACQSSMNMTYKVQIFCDPLNFNWFYYYCIHKSDNFLFIKNYYFIIVIIISF